MHTRRSFIKRTAKLGLVGATTSLWANPFASRAFAQSVATAYKAIVVITLEGGNDGNNTIVPMDQAAYAEYAQIRGSLALPLSSLIPLQATAGQPQYGMHPSLVNVAKLYNQQRAAVIANVGPLVAPVTKQALMTGQGPWPDSLLAHPNGVAQWESASGHDGATTGWGGRMADVLAGQSGSLPPLLNGGVQSIFTAGNSVQAVAVQGGAVFPALPPDLQTAINAIANSDLSSSNPLIRLAAKVRQASLGEQAIINQASSYRPLKTTFPSSTGTSGTMQTIAQIIAGNTVVGATRQIFYAQQGSYDFHANQLPLHISNLTDLDLALGAFFEAMDEIGMSDQVLVCTHSDFNRTFTSNVDAGSDHGWGNHHLLLGGVKGGRIYGTMPTLELNGSDDINGMGIWIPTTSVAQLAGGIASWMGLNTSQIATVIPELANFPAGQLVLS